MTARLAIDRDRLVLLAADPTLSMSRMAQRVGCSVATLRARLIEFKIHKPQTYQRRSTSGTGSTLAPDDVGIAGIGDLAKEQRQLLPWPAWIRFDDAKVPAERFLGKVGAAPIEQSAASPLLAVIGKD